MVDRQLIESCRVLRGMLSKPNPPLPALLPHVREVLAGVEDLSDRIALIEIALRAVARPERMADV